MFSVINDDDEKKKVKATKMFISPGKVCGIAVLCFFVLFAIYCCCFCKCDKRNYSNVSQNMEIRTELPMTRRRGVAISSPATTPSVLPDDNFNATISKPPPSYEEVITEDYHLLTRGLATMTPRGVATMAPPTYSESVVMVHFDESELLQL